MAVSTQSWAKDWSQVSKGAALTSWKLCSISDVVSGTSHLLTLWGQPGVLHGKICSLQMKKLQMFHKYYVV